MEMYGIRFRVDNVELFKKLRSLFVEAKRDKDAECARDPNEWIQLVPHKIKEGFSWPTPEDRKHWLTIRD